MSCNLNQPFFISDKMTLGERINYVITKNTIDKIYSKLEIILYLEMNKYLRISRWISILTGKGTIPSDALQALKNEYGIGSRRIIDKSKRRVALRKEVNDILNENLNVSSNVVNECASKTFNSKSNIKKMLLGTLCPQANVIKYYSERYKYPFYRRSSDEERMINFFIKKIIMKVDGKESPRFNISMSLEKKIEYFDKAMWFYENIKILGNTLTECDFIFDCTTDIKECESLLLNKINNRYEDSILYPDDNDDDFFDLDEIEKKTLSFEFEEQVDLYIFDEISKRYIC
ncbi:hypothetical protein FYJ38_21910 [Clostridium sp. WB02_MRS01]|uniref:hypothetical protein n=1 Tax=Clostridium sp. WB02_MRS01 TaxID=2605777 RepID=UPI0012B283BD|nr:hypothetical protein [Clostridium sp. WB02_MRS01]MSS11277.1 hypothetical protein [Clostridium sp. WB02_MRS01]